MTTMEIVLNMLSEATTTELSKMKEPKNFSENKKVAQEVGAVAGSARKDIEARTGTPVLSQKNAQDLNKIIGNVIDEIAAAKDSNDE